MSRDLKLFGWAYATLVVFLLAFVMFVIYIGHSMYIADPPHVEFNRECLDNGGRPMHTVVEERLVCMVDEQIIATYGG